ncbi:MAG: hypothetical protein IJ859_03130 [Synergistaceae bacterium]|nr:hypothetical protein [Synergistaceae bacterium]
MLYEKKRVTNFVYSDSENSVDAGFDFIFTQSLRQSHEESYFENIGISYKLCIATGIVLLGFFYYFTFWTANTTNYTNDGTGIISILVCISPAASGVMTLMTHHLSTQVEAIITAMLVIHSLSMIWIVIHIFKKIPVPKNALVLVSRIWTFTSVGLLILAIIIAIYLMFHNGNNNNYAPPYDRRR